MLDSARRKGQLGFVVVISRGTLREAWERHRNAEHALRAWYQEALSADWSNPAALRNADSTVSTLRAGRAVFNIKGNDFRLVVYIRYKTRTIYIKWFGTHAEYDRVDAQTVEP